MPRIRIFISYDGDHDTDLGDRLRAQCESSNSAFEFAAQSQGGEITPAWTRNSRTRIESADEVVVICGEHSDASPHMAAELRIVQEEGKPYLLLWGRREQMCTRPEGARADDPMYSWTQDILATQLAAALRKSKPLEVPDRLKRPRGDARGA